MMTPTILALDPALQTGWAHSNGKSGSMSIERPGHYGNRLIFLLNWLRETHRRWPFMYLAFEDATYGAPHANTKVAHARLQGAMLIFAAEKTLVTIDVRPAEVKAMTGKGNAKKADMVRAAEIQLGRKVADDNEADALFVLEYAKQRIDLGGRLKPRAQKKPRKPRKKAAAAQSLFDSKPF